MSAHLSIADSPQAAREAHRKTIIMNLKVWLSTYVLGKRNIIGMVTLTDKEAFLNVH